MKILLVDDDPDMLSVAQMSLEKIGGYSVIKAKEGKHVVEHTRSQHPDLILLDYMLPDMNGATIIKLLQEEGLADVPVIFLTAKSNPEEIEEMKALGARGVIVKPYDPMQLPKQIQQILHP